MDNKRLTPEQFAQWTAALRSGRYKQQRLGQLKNEHGYCCLGVLNEELNLGCRTQRRGFLSWAQTGDYIGLHKHDQLRLADKNDSRSPEYDFNQIADYIDQEIAPKYAKEQSNAQAFE